MIAVEPGGLAGLNRARRISVKLGIAGSLVVTAADFAVSPT
jgi:hypothetical protein